MTKSKRKSSSGGNNGIATVIVLVVVLVLGICFMMTGADPLGLFEGGEPTIQANNPPTRTPRPSGGQEPTRAAPTSDEPSDNPDQTADWYEVYFVNSIRVPQAQEEEYGAKGLPPELFNGSLAERLVQQIDEAQESIHIAAFETDLVDVANALIRAKKRGVDVKWLTDDEYGLEKDGQPGHGQFALMKKAKIEVKDDQRSGLMHNKFWVFDNEVVWTGSTNVTISGMFEQNNNLVIVYSPELAEIYEAQFAHMWAGEIGARAPSDVDGQTINIDGTTIQVLFSPEDNAIEHLVPYIQEAQDEIVFLAFSYTQPDLGEAMLDKLKDGVQIRGVFEKTGSDTEYSEMKPLHCAGGEMRQDGNFAFMHHKVIVVDGRYVITGSLNFSDSANKQNSENVIIFDNPQMAQSYLDEFERVWNAATELDPAEFKCK